MSDGPDWSGFPPHIVEVVKMGRQLVEGPPGPQMEPADFRDRVRKWPPYCYRTGVGDDYDMPATMWWNGPSCGAKMGLITRFLSDERKPIAFELVFPMVMLMDGATEYATQHAAWMAMSDTKKEDPEGVEKLKPEREAITAEPNQLLRDVRLMGMGNGIADAMGDKWVMPRDRPDRIEVVHQSVMFADMDTTETAQWRIKRNPNRLEDYEEMGGDATGRFLVWIREAIKCNREFPSGAEAMAEFASRVKEAKQVLAETETRVYEVLTS